MRPIFADALYWIAITHRRDQWHQAAVIASRSLVNRQLVTTDEVLTEVLNAFAEAGPFLRRESIALVHDLLNDVAATVVPQSRQTFLAGVALYEARLDKGYSLTDCVSMATMWREGIREVLTRDRHFVQEGFINLL
jgi:predicted nucleic acid-binding protein